MKDRLIQLLLLLPTFNFMAIAQTSAITDPVFEQVLIDQGIDTDGTINGQIATADALNVTSLTILSPYTGDEVEWITDLTGIEAFTNLETLTVNLTMIEQLNISTLVNLKYLDCVDNMLTSLDVSGNPLLEYLSLFMGGDVLPINNISEIDLSNNPNIHTLNAYGIDYINLKNGNNNPDMVIDISAGTWGMDPEHKNGHTCIEVDDEAAAQSGQLPYSQWEITHENQSYELVEVCSLSVSPLMANKAISVYPNPVSDVLHINAQGTPVHKAELYDTAGRLVKEYVDINNSNIFLSGTEKGTYLLKIVTDKGSQNAYIIVQ